MSSSRSIIRSTSLTIPEEEIILLAKEEPCLEERSSSFNRPHNGTHVCKVGTARWVEWVEGGIKRCNENGAGDDGSKQSSVCRNIREKLRRVNPDAYTPTFFRFGPFHATYDESCLQTKHKMEIIAKRGDWQAFHDLREKIKDDEVTMKNFYQWQESRTSMPSSHKYSTYLALDALMIASRLSENGPPMNEGHDSLQFFDDIVLFENQIPLSAITLAYECKHKVESLEAKKSVLTQVDKFWRRNPTRILFDFPSSLTQDHKMNSVHNSCLLSLLYKLFAGYIITFPPGWESTSGAQIQVNPEMETFAAHVPIPTATKLRERTGIRFKPTKEFPRVKFDAEKRTLFLPKIHVGTTTERVLRNVLAYEAESGVVSRGKRVVTGYVLLMDDLIDKDGDVEVLVESGVIINSMGSHEAVANLWNNLCTELPRCSTEGLVSEARKVSAYYGMKVNRWKALFYEIYWQRKPWLLISIVTAFLLLGLTLLQTVYTIWAFYKPSRSSIFSTH